jgi:hypothetical protein
MRCLRERQQNSGSELALCSVSPYAMDSVYRIPNGMQYRSGFLTGRANSDGSARQLTLDRRFHTGSGGARWRSFGKQPLCLH